MLEDVRLKEERQQGQVVQIEDKPYQILDQGRDFQVVDGNLKVRSGSDEYDGSLET